MSNSHSHIKDGPAQQPVAATHSLQSEGLVIAKTLRGDVEAFNNLVLRYQNLAFSVAFRILQCQESAEDVVQDTFLKAFCALDSYPGGSFKSWLMRILVNNCYDTLRRSRHQAHDALWDDDGCDEVSDGLRQPVDAHESPQERVERMELHAQIEKGIRNLSREQRIVVILCDIHGCTYEEISEITGYEMGTVKSRLSRARARLRDMLNVQPEPLPAGRCGLPARA